MNANTSRIYRDNANNLNKIVYDGSSQQWGSPKQIATGTLTSSGDRPKKKSVKKKERPDEIHLGVQSGSGISVVNDGKKLYAFYAKKQASVFTMYQGQL